MHDQNVVGPVAHALEETRIIPLYLMRPHNYLSLLVDDLICCRWCDSIGERTRWISIFVDASQPDIVAIPICDSSSKRPFYPEAAVRSAIGAWTRAFLKIAILVDALDPETRVIQVHAIKASGIDIQ